MSRPDSEAGCGPRWCATGVWPHQPTRCTPAQGRRTVHWHVHSRHTCAIAPSCISRARIAPLRHGRVLRQSVLARSPLLAKPEERAAPVGARCKESLANKGTPLGRPRGITGDAYLDSVLGTVGLLRDGSCCLRSSGLGAGVRSTHHGPFHGHLEASRQQNVGEYPD